ncbi:MAG: GNAT family N-acetyltransferase, partial [Chloroflexi bacterium]|nr:GNAT family N-acetyltransferase [Chloroflexota bacterium]
MDDVAAFTLQGLGLCQYREGGFGAQAAHGAGQVGMRHGGHGCGNSFWGDNLRLREGRRTNSIVADSNQCAPATIRRMRDDDAEAAARLLRAAYGTPDGGAIAMAGGPDLPLTAGRVRRWRQDSAAAWIAEIPAYGPIGAVFAIVEPEAAWVAGLGVAPHFRGAGVGAALTDHAIKFLKVSGRPVTGMEAVPSAVGAVGMYARRGFRPADLTVRLRGTAARICGPVAPNSWREVACSKLDDQTPGREPALVARFESQPHSSASFVLIGSNVTLLCDPDPLIPA